MTAARRYQKYAGGYPGAAGVCPSRDGGRATRPQGAGATSGDGGTWGSRNGQGTRCLTGRTFAAGWGEFQHARPRDGRLTEDHQQIMEFDDHFLFHLIYKFGGSTK